MKNLFARHPQKRVFITGGASGIGQALALRFAAANWRVAIADIHQQRMQETVEQIKQLGGEPLAIELNVASADDWDKARDTIENSWGGIDILFNNAGVAGGGSFEGLDISEWQRITDINYWGVIYGCRAFLPLLKKQGSGHILNTASCAGLICAGEMGPYNATKAAVIAISETLHKELRGHGIDVGVILPTVVKTNVGENKNAQIKDSPSASALLGQIEHSNFTADQAASAILKGVSKRRLYIFTRIDGAVGYLLKRLMPQASSNLVRWMVDKRVGLFSRKD